MKLIAEGPLSRRRGLLRVAAALLAPAGFALAPLAVAAAETAASGAAGAPPPTYAVLSLIGDEFSVIMRRPDVASRIDANDKRAFPVADAIFDQVAFEAAERTLKQARPTAPVLRFSIRDARLFQLQDRVLADTPDSRVVREALLKLLRDNQATHLVLVTKRRDDASFRLEDGHTGAGKIAGLGFYIDPLTPLRLSSGGYAYGYFAPYAYMDVALIDVASLRVLRSIPVLESSMTTDTAASATFRAWDALTGQQKVDALDRLIRKGVGSAVASALAG